MENWELSLDRMLTNPPDEPESHLFCEGDRCREPFQPGDDIYVIEGCNLCEECAKEWLYQQKHTATEEECYGEL